MCQFDAKLSMPIKSQPLVELLCDFPMTTLLVPMAYNIVLTFCCVFFGFATRKLPENFNESWFIFISVSTTLFLWLVMLPSYFLASYASHRAAILAFCLILNSYITAVLLYVPKLYALRFLTEEKMNILGTLGGASIAVVPTSATMVGTLHH